MMYVGMLFFMYKIKFDYGDRQKTEKAKRVSIIDLKTVCAFKFIYHRYRRVLVIFDFRRLEKIQRN